jgi:F-type H+-transporting ATPase subunit a
LTRKVKWGIFGFIALGALALLAVLPGGAREEFSVADEFTLHPIISLPSLAGVDLSVNKAVIELWVATAVLVVLSLVISRTIKKQPGRFQYIVEVLYELARDSIVGDVMKSGKATWFPYIGAVFFFVLASNLIGLLPLPLGENWQPSYYAATANLYVTLTLALFTFVFTHYAGIRKNGFRYFVNWAPPSAPPVLKQLIWVIHVVSEVFRLVSLSVRLFASACSSPWRSSFRTTSPPSCCRAAPCSSTCSRSSWPSSRPSSSPSSPLCTSAGRWTRSTDTCAWVDTAFQALDA